MIGMLWKFDPKETLEQSVTIAAAYYEKKYGRCPDVVQVHRRDVLAYCPDQIEGISVVKVKDLQPGHLLIGEKALINTKARALTALATTGAKK